MRRRGWWLTLRPPERVSSLVTTLGGVGLFPEGQTWWFAWNALDIILPSVVLDTRDLDGDWEVLRVFSARVELRVGRRGRHHGYWLLLEEDPQATLGNLYSDWVSDTTGDFDIEEGNHVLAGRKLRLPQGELRGEINYPRPLDYDLGEDHLDQALVARVRGYYDRARRLVTVRYAGIEWKTPVSTAVQAFPDPKDAMSAVLSS